MLHLNREKRYHLINGEFLLKRVEAEAPDKEPQLVLEPAELVFVNMVLFCSE